MNQLTCCMTCDVGVGILACAAMFKWVSKSNKALDGIMELGLTGHFSWSSPENSQTRRGKKVEREE